MKSPTATVDGGGGGGEGLHIICVVPNIMETMKICVFNQVMVTVSNNLKSVTPRVPNFEACFIF